MSRNFHLNGRTAVEGLGTTAETTASSYLEQSFQDSMCPLSFIKCNFVFRASTEIKKCHNTLEPHAAVLYGPLHCCGVWTIWWNFLTIRMPLRCRQFSLIIKLRRMVIVSVMKPVLPSTDTCNFPKSMSPWKCTAIERQSVESLSTEMVSVQSPWALRLKSRNQDKDKHRAEGMT
jgi:hypothetical protein